MSINWKSGRIASGKLRHRIDLVKVSPVQDTAGGINLNNNTLYAQVWASVEPMSGMETMAANAQTTVDTYQMVLRYIGAAPAWQPDTVYLGKGLVRDRNGYLQQAQSGGGLSGTIEPDWSEVEGEFTEDGDPSTGVVWLNVGLAPLYTGVTSALQVWWQGRQFQITTVQNPDGRNKMLCIMAVEINDSRQQLHSEPVGNG
jgi:head-tail adaptor